VLPPTLFLTPCSCCGVVEEEAVGVGVAFSDADGEASTFVSSS